MNAKKKLSTLQNIYTAVQGITKFVRKNLIRNQLEDCFWTANLRPSSKNNSLKVGKVVDNIFDCPILVVRVSHANTDKSTLSIKWSRN